MPRRLDEVRRSELLDKLMSLIAARGFSEVPTSKMASEIGCSVSSLYKIAPNKQGLVLLAIAQWRETVFDDMEMKILRCNAASDRARTFFRAGAEKLHPMSLAFYRDIQRFEFMREAWRVTVVDHYIDRFIELVRLAEDAGEIRPVNVRFLGETLRQVGFLTRDDRVLAESGLTSEQAVIEINRMVWDGIRKT